ncbi:MAG TPA: SgcJ/EcaC family oxidoreductase [Pyrinomonadaceae bacterium]|nr:SgcJ/EcaC family oxidoreductase [Pyrinomonadaceae bacterium]
MTTQATKRRILCTFALLTIVLLTCSVGVRAQRNRAADEAALRENVKLMEDGWNTKSGALFAKPFAEDADYVVINGMYIKGREAIAAGHQRIFDTIYKDTNLKLTVKQFRFLRADVAVVHVMGQREGATKELPQSAMITVFMTKEKQGWTIAAFQNTAIAPPQ